MRFKFDSSSFRRDLEREVEKIANVGIQDLGHQLQRGVDRVYQSSSGRPVEEIMAELHKLLHGMDWKFNDADIRPWAEAISSGERVVIEAKRIRH